MVDVLRADPGSLGMVTGVGWYLTKHSIGIYGTEPPGSRPGPEGPQEIHRNHRNSHPGGPPRGDRDRQAGGFAWASPQRAVAALPQCSPDADAQGEVTVETYSVAYDGTAHPSGAVVACRTPDGRRAWANVTDPDHWPCWSPKRGAAGSAPSGPMARWTWADRVEAGADPHDGDGSAGTDGGAWGSR